MQVTAVLHFYLSFVFYIPNLIGSAHPICRPAPLSLNQNLSSLNARSFLYISGSIQANGASERGGGGGLHCHFTRCLMQIRSDTCECHLYNGRPFTISFQVCTYSCDPTTRRTGCFTTARTPDAGEPRQMDVIFWPRPIFFTANAQLSLFSGKCMRPDAARPPPARVCAPTTLPIDKVARFCQKKTVWGGRGRFGASEGGCRRRFSISLYTAFQMMTEIKHTLRCRSLRLPVPVVRSAGPRCVWRETVENCSFFGPILDQLTTILAISVATAAFAAALPSVPHSFSRVNHGTSFSANGMGWPAAAPPPLPPPPAARPFRPSSILPSFRFRVENYPSFPPPSLPPSLLPHPIQLQPVD